MRWSMNASCEAEALGGLVHICACGTGPNEREGAEGAASPFCAETKTEGT
jgi:hypothetical protein